MCTFVLFIPEKPQVIEPKDISQLRGSLKQGFGYTISRDKIDVDDNNCKDFAIGYPNSNIGILFRSKEVVILTEISDPITINSSSIDPPKNPETGKIFSYLSLLASLLFKKLMF